MAAMAVMEVGTAASAVEALAASVAGMAADMAGATRGWAVVVTPVGADTGLADTGLEDTAAADIPAHMARAERAWRAPVR